ncbi:MAG: G5 domain-containing protein, partial [Acidimicrobiia bacterium]
ARTPSGDTRARRYALRAVRPSPARLVAPEPSAWLPILDLTEELEAIDLTGELELLALEEGRVDLEAELTALESDFWRTVEAEHPFLTGEFPAIAPIAESLDADLPADVAREAAADAPETERQAVTIEDVVAPVPAVRPESTTALTTAPTRPASISLLAPVTESITTPMPTLTPAEPRVIPAVAPQFSGPDLPVPDAYAQIRPNRPAIAHRRRSLRLRRRIIVTALVVTVAAACIGVTARVVGGTHPRRDVTVSIDGRANTVVTRAGTVGDLLAAQGTVLRAGDRVVPDVSTQLRQGMPINIVRAFPIVVDVDGVITERRTTRRSVAVVRRELGLPAALVALGAPKRLARGSRVVLRTPHSLNFLVDATTTPLVGVTDLTVADLLRTRAVVLGPKDEVQPALETRLSDGLTVQVFRLADGEAAEDQIIPFKTELREDSTLAAGHTAVIQAGRNGTVRVVSKVVRKDGAIVQSTEARRIVLAAPVTEILRRGTKVSGTQKPVPAPAASGGQLFQSGTATWYASHAGPGACAHLTLPFGTIVKIVNTANNRSAQCRVGDRGPMAYTGHIIDLNPDVFAALAPLGTGTISVRLYVS